MKKTFNLVVLFSKEEFNAGYLIFTFLFLSALLSVNYYYDFEHFMRLNYRGTNLYYPICFLYYGIPYVGSILAYLFFYHKTHLIKNKQMCGTVVWLLGTLMLNEAFNLHRIYLANHCSVETLWFIQSCTTNVVSVLLYFIPLVGYWLVYDRKSQALYGFNKSFDAKPYLIMILLMFPLLLWASFQKDFLEAYPVYPGKGFIHLLNLENWQGILLFETAYSLDFVAVEFVFRGFMVLAIGKYLGKGAIMPMVTLYCLFHFGKPLGEAISSIFGGYILGILAYYTRSIYGGIIIHLGVALMMELLAMIQKGI